MADRTEDKTAGTKPTGAAGIKPAGDTKVAVKPAAEAKPVSAVPAPTPAKSDVVAASAPAKAADPKPVAAAAKPIVPALKVVPPAKPAPVAAAKPAPAPALVAKRGPGRPAKPKPAPVAEVPVAKTVAPKPQPVIASVPAKPAAAKPLSEGKPVMATNAFSPDFTTFMPTTDKLQSAFGEFQGRAKAQMEKTAKLAEEMGEFAKGNVEAMMTSGRVAAKGAETIGQDAAEYSKKSFESASAAFKSMVAAKSPTELFTLQSDYARKSFDTAVAEASKFSEAWLKLAGEIVQPLSTRVSLAADKFKATVN